MGFDDDQKFTDADLTCAVLYGLPKFDPGTLDDYRQRFGGEGPEPIEIIRRCYKMDCMEYRNVIRLFSDIMDEFIDTAYKFE